MKKNTANKIRLGIFLSIGIVVFILGIYFIGERQQLFRDTFNISAVFKDIGGLQAGNNVRFLGINVGTIENIVIVSDSTVKVEIMINESTRKFIKKDAVAIIGSEGIMGNKILIITPGLSSKNEIEDNDTIATVQPTTIENILASIKTSIDNTVKVTNDLSNITGSIKSGHGIISKLLMDSSLAQNIDSTLINLREGSVKLNRGFTGINNLVDDAKISFNQNFDSTLINLKAGSVKLNQGLSGLKDLVDDAKISFDQNFDSTFINLKEGSAGFKILMDKAKRSWLLWGF